jgi:long-chain fatty acid transport protein
MGDGFNMALHYKPTNWLAMGFVYRSQVEQTVKGDVTFDRPTFLTNTPLFKDTEAKGNITLPDSFTIGIMITPISSLTLETDLTYTRWSTYDELTIEYDDPIIIAVQPTIVTLPSKTVEKDWHDTWRFQFGAEYSLNDLVDLRASYVYDQSPIPDEHVDYMVPANNRHLFGLGTGFHWNNWVVDVSYTYLLIEDRDIDERTDDNILEGEFKNGHSHLIGLSIGYKF